MLPAWWFQMTVVKLNEPQNKTPKHEFGKGTGEDGEEVGENGGCGKEGNWNTLYTSIK